MGASAGSTSDIARAAHLALPPAASLGSCPSRGTLVAWISIVRCLGMYGRAPDSVNPPRCRPPWSRESGTRRSRPPACRSRLMNAGGRCLAPLPGPRGAALKSVGCPAVGNGAGVAASAPPRGPLRAVSAQWGRVEDWREPGEAAPLARLAGGAKGCSLAALAPWRFKGPREIGPPERLPPKNRGMTDGSSPREGRVQR